MSHKGRIIIRESALSEMIVQKILFQMVAKKLPAHIWRQET